MSKIVTTTGGSNSSMRRTISSWLAVGKHRLSASRSQSHAVPARASHRVGSKIRLASLIGHPLARGGGAVRGSTAKRRKTAAASCSPNSCAYGPLPPLGTRFGPQ